MALSKTLQALLIFDLVTRAVVQMCPRRCGCSLQSRSINCDRLHYIPKIPDYIDILTLQNCYFENIDRGTFINVTKNYLYIYYNISA